MPFYDDLDRAQRVQRSLRQQESDRQCRKDREAEELHRSIFTGDPVPHSEAIERTLVQEDQLLQKYGVEPLIQDSQRFLNKNTPPWNRWQVIRLRGVYGYEITTGSGEASTSFYAGEIMNGYILRRRITDNSSTGLYVGFIDESLYPDAMQWGSYVACIITGVHRDRAINGKLSELDNDVIGKKQQLSTKLSSAILHASAK